MHDEGSRCWSNTSIQSHTDASPAWGCAKGGTVSKSAAEADRWRVGFRLRSARMDALWALTSTRDFSKKFANPTSRRGNTTLLSMTCRPASSTWCIHVGCCKIWRIRKLRSGVFAALRPGGWLLVEGMDFFPIHTAPSQLYIDLMVGLAGVIASSGGNDFGGRALPAIVAKQGLSNVQAEGDFAVLNAGSPMAEFFRLSALQVRDGIVRSGAVATAQFDAAIALLEDPGFWAFGPGGVAVRGQKPR
jgi:hypothetical protein